MRIKRYLHSFRGNRFLGRKKSYLLGNKLEWGNAWEPKSIRKYRAS